jgi:hypothetical protein
MVCSASGASAEQLSIEPEAVSIAPSPRRWRAQPL